VPWRGGESPVAREHAYHDGAQPAPVHLVTLEHECWVARARLGASRLAEVDPPDLTAPNHRFFFLAATRSRTTAFVRCRARTAAGSSPGCPPRSMARFHASVASSAGRWL